MLFLRQSLNRRKSKRPSKNILHVILLNNELVLNTVFDYEQLFQMLVVIFHFQRELFAFYTFTAYTTLYIIKT